MEAANPEEVQSSPSKSISSSSLPVSTAMPMRFVRLNPRFDRQETLNLLQSDIRSSHPDAKYPILVPWLFSRRHRLEFFAIPGEFGLKKASSFRSGRVYGMDVTSGAAVAALLFDVFDRPDSSGRNRHESREEKEPLRVLDLCCAPGLKLCMISDLVPANSFVLGVDASKSRLSLCKNIIQKYRIDATTSGSNLTKNHTIIDESATETVSQLKRESHSPVKIRLYCADGTTFGTSAQPEQLVFDSTLAYEQRETRGERKRMNKSARSREKRRLLELSRRANNDSGSSRNDSNAGRREEPSSMESEEKMTSVDEEPGSSSLPPFDRVLVDAECSSDGAIRHIRKRQSSSSSSSRGPAWDDSNMDELVDLQKRLIDSGFRLLKSGGTLLYSTCSLSTRQNEDVVDWLLKRYNDAFIIPVSFLQHVGAECAASELQFIRDGAISGTVRFKPRVNSAEDDCLLSGGGFFLAKIGKRHE